MKKWFYAVNTLHLTCSVYLEKAPWYVFFAEWLVDSSIFSCHYIPDIPLPNILPRKRDTIKGCVCENRDIHCSGHENLYTLKEWFGDLSDWYHVSICSPIFNWAWKHTDTKFFNVAWEELKAQFPEDKEYFEKCEKENIQYLKEE